LALIFFNGGTARTLNGAVIKAFTPFMNLSLQVSRFRGLVFGGLTAEEAKELILENQRFKARDFSVEKLKIENARLEKALGFKEKNKLNLAGARILMYSRELGKEFLLIDQGKESNIIVGDAVISHDNIFIGTIQESGNGFSKVKIASNREEALEGEVIPGETKVLIKGEGGRFFSFEFIPVESPIRRGDFVAVRRGARKLFLVGEITSIKKGGNTAFQEARGVSLISPESLQEIFVVKNNE